MVEEPISLSFAFRPLSNIGTDKSAAQSGATLRHMHSHYLPNSNSLYVILFYGILCDQNGCANYFLEKKNKSTYIDIFMLYFPKENKAFSFTRRFFLLCRGHVFGDFSCDDCDCITNLTLGTVIAEELRNTLKDKFNLTTSAGESIMLNWGA